MAAILFHEPVFATDVGSGFELRFYEVGTTTGLTVYLDSALSTPAPQPIVADSVGRFPPIYIDSTGNPPKVVLSDPDEVQEWTVDEYPIEDLATLESQVAQLQTDMEAVEGDLLTAESDIDQLETDVADHESRIETLEGEEGVGDIGAGARVRRTSSQSAAGGTQTNVNFNTTDYDDADIAVSDVLTVPTGVTRVIVTAGLTVTHSQNGQVTVRIRKNGSGYGGMPQSSQLNYNSPFSWSTNLSTGELNVSAGDTFQLEVDPGFSSTIESGAWMNMAIMK